MKFHILSGLLLTIIFSSESSGQQYFQQKVDTKIEVTLDDVSHMLRGHIHIDYYNNAPDTLTYIYMHLWPNAYSSDRTAYNQQAVENGSTDFYTADKNDWGIMDSLRFEVDRIEVNTEPAGQKDIVILRLNEPLLPGEQVQISTPFKVQIPETFSRLGHSGQSYQISQWYPKPAVYDKDGWHPIPYLDQGEFYSEFGSYDVQITLPKNYIVMATGNLQNAEEETWLAELSRKDVQEYASRPDDIPSSVQFKTLRYMEDNVHDFAWFADKSWMVRMEEFTIPESGQSVKGYTAFFPDHYKGWDSSIQYLKNATLDYSREVGPYPFRSVKAVEGRLIAGGGMEYPTVTIIIPSNDPKEVEEVIIHEIGHNWFYGILANNERKYPWMDESINSFYENKFMKSDGDLVSNLEDLFINQMRVTYQAQAINLPATDYTYTNYGLDIYRTGAEYFAWLEAYLGEEQFRAAMQSYYARYQFRHVYPEDIKATFEESTATDLSWFFDELLGSEYPVDFRIRSIQSDGQNTTVNIRNNSPVPAPAVVVLYEPGDSAGGQKYQKIISKPFTGTTSVTIPNQGIPYKQGFIDPVTPDHISRNNHYRKGSSRHFKIKPLAFLNNAEYTSMAIAPALGYNYYDGFMLGLLFHNISIPYSKFTYGIAPVYGFKSRNAAGTGFLSYKQYTLGSRWLHHIEYKLEGKSFGWQSSQINVQDRFTSRYIKVAPELILDIRKPYARSPLERSISLKAYYVKEQNLVFNRDPSDSLYKPSIGQYQDRYYGRIRYRQHYASTYNPYGFSLDMQAGKTFGKISAEGNIRIDYHFRKKALYARVFVGKFFNFNTDPHLNRRYQLTTTYSGWNDYLYDHTFLARNENDIFWSRQIAMQEGGLKINTLMYANQLGLSQNWLTAINLRSDIPFVNLPVQLFADIATFTEAKSSNPTGSKFLWDAGVQVNISDIVQVYIPLLYSKDYQEYMTSIYGKNAFWNSISFTFNINKIQWSRPLESTGLNRLMK